MYQLILEESFVGQSRSRKSSVKKLLEENKHWTTLADAQQEIEALFRNQALEHGALVSENGTLIVEEIGEEDSVEFFVRDLKRLSNGAFFHNHPSGNTFSPRDIKIACDFNPVFLSVFGINADGISCSYTMNRPRSGWPSTRELSMAYAKAVRNAKNYLYRQHAKGLISMRDFDLGIAHEEMKRLAKLIGAEYYKMNRM